jgi:hypothetical protein
MIPQVLVSLSRLKQADAITVTTDMQGLRVMLWWEALKCS